jgi:glycosyltransferase involved in cell wall biosynthesis
MKIVHVATTEYGGAGIGLLNLHRALLACGEESSILVRNKTLADDTIQQMQPNFHLFRWSKNRWIRIIQKVLRKKGKCKTVVEQWDEAIKKASIGHQSICYTSPFSNYDITEHPLVKDSDIVHLHWVGNFLDYQSFFTKINKPVVWTLRDENPGLGGFHYVSDRFDYGDYYEETERNFFQVKRDSLLNKENVSLVALSEVMNAFCNHVDYLANKKVVKIYNPIDGEAYYSVDKRIARKALGIDDEVLTVSFVSVYLSDHRKGLSALLSAKGFVDKRMRILCVGKNDYFTQADDDIICFGSVENTKLMSLIYSASDMFVNPTRQESFGKTTVEALMCGVPVVMTKEGVAPEIINDTSGYIIDDLNPQTIADAITYVSDKKYDRERIREAAKVLFDPQTIANEYIKLYRDCLSYG